MADCDDAGGDLMADQCDVENAIASIIANALYPDGTATPSVVGTVCRVYRGYPTAPSLDADLANGVLNISVNASSGTLKNVTRYPRRWVPVAPAVDLLLAEMTGKSAIFSGSCALGQLAGVIINDSLFSYAVQFNDSPATVASNLAAMLRAAGWVVDYSGASLGVPGAERFTAQIVTGVNALKELKRQVQEFCITLWCPDPTTRDVVSPIIDEAIASLIFIPLADGSYARLVFVGTNAKDNAADTTEYQRDIIYSAEYATTISQVSPAMLFGTASMIVNSVSVQNSVI